MLRIDYQLTAHDLAEARAVNTELRIRRPGRGGRIIIGVAVMVAIMGLLLEVGHRIGGVDERFLPFHFLLPLGAAMVLGASWRLQTMRRAYGRRKAILWGAITVITLTGMGIEMMHPGPARNDPHGSAWLTGKLAWSLASPHLVWLMYVGSAIGWAIFGRKIEDRRTWEGATELQRHKTAEFSDVGVRIWDDVTEMNYRWAGFVRWFESENLFLLFTSEGRYVMVPKGAFADAELERARGWMGTIGQAERRGFAVMPVMRVAG